MTDTRDNKQVPLGFKAGNNGNYTLAFSIPDTMQTVLLEDRLNQTIEDIRQSGKYTFSSRTSDNTNRFVIHFTTKIDQEQIPVLVYISGGQIVVDASSLDEDFNVKVYDTIGRFLYSKKLMGRQVENIPLKVKGVYFVSLSTQTRNKVFKITN